MQPNNTEQPSANSTGLTINTQKKNWYKNTSWTVLLLIFFPILGIILMFKWMRWSVPVKVVVTFGSAIILIIQTCILLGLLLYFGAMYLFAGFSTSVFGSEPNITAETKQDAEAFLKYQYGKSFEVTNIKKVAPVMLGDRWSLRADAYPGEDKELKVSVSWEADGSSRPGEPKYRDSYLSAYWSKEDRPVLKNELSKIFGKDSIPEHSSQVGSITGSAYPEIIGRTISLQEASDDHKNEVPYRLSVDLGEVAGEASSVAYNSQKLYQVTQYMKSRFMGEQSNLKYKYTTGGTAYVCDLFQFTFQIADDPAQLAGCWVRTPIDPTKTIQPRLEKSNTINGDVLSFNYRLNSGWTANKTQTANSTEGSYIILDDNSNLKINLDYYSQGAGKDIDDLNNISGVIKQWADNNIGLRIQGDKQYVAYQTMLSRYNGLYIKDEEPGTRTVHYVVMYKSFTVHLYADTLSYKNDERAEEYNIVNFIQNIEPLNRGSESW